MADVIDRLTASAPSVPVPGAGDSRAVSTTVGYVLNLGVATILVTTLLLSAGTLVENQRQAAARTELSVVGERVASDLATADQLARASDGGTVRLVVRVPERVVGSTYEIRVNQTGDERVVLVASDPDVRVTVPFDSETTVPATIQPSGAFVIVYNDTKLVIEDA
ncbi:DUF7266 family protein [Halobacterium zhouii]|uniref:DUF7266 family protein n=1 Tax=Halobacterium zhouii TaxID=2902624 RepID=UPI001E2E2954|nr:hypothetical protein [Halobacterium zhouii]